MASLKNMINNKEERRYRSNKLEEVVEILCDELPIFREDLIFNLKEDKENKSVNISNQPRTNYDPRTKIYTISSTENHSIPEITISILSEYANVSGGYKFRDLSTKLKDEKREELMGFQQSFEDFLYQYNPIINHEHYKLRFLDDWLVETEVTNKYDRNERLKHICYELLIEIDDSIIQNVEVWGKMPYMEILERVETSLDIGRPIKITDRRSKSVLEYIDGMLIFTDGLGNQMHKGEYNSLKRKRQQLEGKDNENNEKDKCKVSGANQMYSNQDLDIKNLKDIKIRIKENDLYTNTDVSWFYRLQSVLNLYTPETFASYKTPDRRFAYHGLIVQGPIQEQKQNIKGVDVYIDTSASMTRDKIIRAISTIKTSAIASLQNNYYVFGSYVEEIKESDIRKGEYKRFGGTQIKPVIDQIKIKGKDRLSLVISDGEFDWNLVDQIQNQTIFLCLTGKKIPHKNNVHVVKAKEV